jgi:hypothetical protein
VRAKRGGDLTGPSPAADDCKPLQLGKENLPALVGAAA